MSKAAKTLGLLGLTMVLALPAIAVDDSNAGGSKKRERGSVEVVVPAAYVGPVESEALSPTPAGGSALEFGALSATCSGCSAWSWASWTSGGATFRGKTQNRADEIIDTQEVHMVLINGDECYDPDGWYSPSYGTGNVSNVEDSAVLDSGHHPEQGGDTWNNANGHNWFDDGQHWAVNGGADICRSF